MKPKKKKYTVTRRQVIHALRTEPLRSGHFFHTYGPETPVEECDVCAVGAVLRKAIPTNTLEKLRKYGLNMLGKKATNYYFAASNEEEALIQISDDNYLGALSIYFETLCCDAGRSYRKVTKPMREKLVKFVKEYFPPTVSFEL